MTNVRRVLAVVAVLFCVALTGAREEPQDGPDSDKQRIQGTWEFVKVLDQGMEQLMPEGMRVVITARMFTVERDGQDSLGQTYTLDATKEPKQMDLFAEIDPGRPIRQPGIYVLDGDKLTIAHAAQGKPRPKTFESKRGDFGGVWVLRRKAEKRVV